MQTICLSFFHRKIGPIVHYIYPETSLSENEKMRIADIMDQAFEEGFFTHSFGKDHKTSMNYYFEIYSDFARGNKEMLMVSIIFDESVPADLEHLVLSWTIDFAEKLKAHREIFHAFYTSDEDAYEPEVQRKIEEMNEKVKLWVKELYWASVEETRKKSEEEKIATILQNREIYHTMKKLSKGPVTLEDLEEWFVMEFHNQNFNEIIQVLQDENYIFINEIGVETYILLVRQVIATRIPPDCIVTLFEKQPELIELIESYIREVQEFFDHYILTDQDSLTLLDLVANPRIYNVLSQLRMGPIQKEKLKDLISEKTLQSLNIVLETLKGEQVIKHFLFQGDQYIVLLTDIQFKTQFPEYLAKLLPKDSKPAIAESISPQRYMIESSEGVQKASELDAKEKIAYFFQRLQGTPETATEEIANPPSIESNTAPVKRVVSPLEAKDPFLEDWDAIEDDDGKDDDKEDDLSALLDEEDFNFKQ